MQIKFINAAVKQDLIVLLSVPYSAVEWARWYKRQGEQIVLLVLVFTTLTMTNDA